MGLAGSNRVVGWGVGIVAPILLLVMLSLTAYYPALTATVGERDRGTLSTLLSCPIPAFDLTLGKFLAVLVASLTGVLAHAASLAICVSLVATQGKLPTAFPDQNHLLWIPPLLLSVAFVISAVSMTVGWLARKASEAQSFLTVFMLVVTIPAGIVSAAELDPTWLTSLVPLMNVAAIARKFGVDRLNPVWLATTVAVNAACGLAVLAFAVNLVKGEFRADPGLSELLALNRSRLRSLTPALGMLIVGVAMAGTIYLQLALASVSPFLVLPITHTVLMVALPVLALRYYGLDWRRELLAVRPAPSAWGVALLAAAASILVMSYLGRFLPFPREMGEEFAKRMMIGGKPAPVALLIFVIGVVPGVCEEFLFRGVVLRSLRRSFPPLWTLLISSALFALMHASLVRFPPTFAMGMLLGSVALRTGSLWPGMLLHVAYNSGIVLLSARSAAIDAGTFPSPALLTLATVMLFGTVAWLARVSPSSHDETGLSGHSRDAA
jgi:membrane protease YdiL (CAAX protease family)/ABC-type transport system involved in multi-copper enzyme maturation permease subunit